MKASIVTQGFKASAAVRNYVSRRLGFALNRSSTLIRAVVVRLADINGPRGGVDKTCSVQLSLPGERPVIVTERSPVLEHAIDRAVHKAAQSVARRLAKRQKPKRGALHFDALPQSS